jgi:hypothetical protein
MNTKAIPRDVKLAVLLTAIAVAIGVFDLVLQSTGITTAQSAASTPGAVAVGVGFTVVFLFLILQRQNWARILYAVLAVLGLIFSVPMLGTELNEDLIGAVSTALQIILQLAALVFLFRPSANAWFRSA